MKILPLLVAFATVAKAATYYVAPSGSDANSGTIDSPWSISHAVSNSLVTAGDTVYLRGGTYSSWPSNNQYYQLMIRQSGTSSNRLTFQSYPGEWAHILATNATYNSNLHVVGIVGNYVDVKNLEISATNCSVYTPNGYYIPVGADTSQPNNRFIGLVVHDVSMGFTMLGNNISNSVIADCLIYNVGDNNATHSCYLQNRAGEFYVDNNCMWGPSAINVKAYGQELGWQNGFLIRSNVLSMPGRTHSNPDILVGGNAATNLTIIGNYIRSATTTSIRTDFGHSSDNYGSNGLISDNYVFCPTEGGVALSMGRWMNMVATNNTVVARWFASAWIDGLHTWAENTVDYNTYINHSNRVVYFNTNNVSFTSFPAWQSVVGYDAHSTIATNLTPADRLAVIPFSRTPNKAWLVAFNWSGSDNISFDVSAIVPSGWSYTIKDAYNFQAGAIASGVYGGGNVVVPATNLVAASALVGASTTHPGPGFVTYMLEAVGPSRYTHTHGSGTLGSSTR